MIVGHSMGGYVVQKYLENNDAPAGVLMASAPPQGSMRASIRMMRRHPWAVFKTNAFGETDAVVKTPRLARAHLFCRHTPQDVVDRCVGRLQPESALAMKQLLPEGRVRTDLVSQPLLAWRCRGRRV